MAQVGNSDISQAEEVGNPPHLMADTNRRSVIGTAPSP
jgi:hypothetical protein